MPLYQRCVHLGCRVPFCNARSGSSARATARSTTGRASTSSDRRRAASTGSRSPSRATSSRWTRPRSSSVLRGGRTPSTSPRRVPSAWRRDRGAAEMLAETNLTGIVLLVLGGVLIARVDRRPRHAEPDPRQGPRDPARDASGSLRRRPRDPVAAALPGLGRPAHRLLRRVVPAAMARRAGPEPHPGRGAPGARPRSRRASCASVHGGEPARRRMHALPRTRAEGRRSSRRATPSRIRRTSPRSATAT